MEELRFAIICSTNTHFVLDDIFKFAVSFYSYCFRFYSVIDIRQTQSSIVEMKG